MSAKTTNPGRQVCDQCWNGTYEYQATCDHTPYLDQPVTCKHCGQWLPCQCSEPKPRSSWTDGTGTKTVKDANGRVISITGPNGEQRATNKYGESVHPAAPKTFALKLTNNELETLEEALRRYVSWVARTFDTASSSWHSHLLEVERIHNHASDTILAAKERGEIR